MGTKVYREKFAPWHPRADRNGYMPAHVFAMESHLGRFLAWHGPSDPRSEIVHHANGNSKDNRIENLRVMRLGRHMKHHRKVETLKRRLSSPRKDNQTSKQRRIRPRESYVFSRVADEFESLLALG